MSASQKNLALSRLNMNLFLFFQNTFFGLFAAFSWLVNLVFCFVNASLLNEIAALVGIIAVLLNKLPSIVVRLIEFWFFCVNTKRRKEILNKWRQLSKKATEHE